jgi:hypothetical protein
MEDISAVTEKRAMKFYSEYMWEKVCRVRGELSNNRQEWYYENINKDVMYANHTSWVYVITLNGMVMKIGESEKPLGIRSTNWRFESSTREIQPIPGSKSRLGQYRRGDTTDARIREALKPYSHDKNNLIEIYALTCPEQLVDYCGKKS